MQNKILVSDVFPKIVGEMVLSKFFSIQKSELIIKKLFIFLCGLFEFAAVPDPCYECAYFIK